MKIFHHILFIKMDFLFAHSHVKPSVIFHRARPSIASSEGDCVACSVIFMKLFKGFIMTDEWYHNSE